MYVKKYLIFIINKDITHQRSEHKKNTNNDESFDCSESFCLGNVGGDGVENVDQNQKYRDQQSHPEQGEISHIQPGASKRGKVIPLILWVHKAII